MANFSENAVRHVIVAKAANDVKIIDLKTGNKVVVDGQGSGSSGAAGTGEVNASAVEKFYIQYVNAYGDIMKSDIVDKDKIRHYAAKPFKVGTQRTVTIKVNKAELTPNTEYSLRVMIREVMSGSQEDQMVGVVSYTTSSATDATALSKELTVGLAEQINKMYGVAGKNYNKLDWPVLTAQGETGSTADTIVIKEVADNLKPWIIGKVQLRSYNFDIYPNPVLSISSTGNTNFESFDWIDASDVDKGLFTKTVGGSLGRGAGKVAADLEYFYHGEIGDFYRMNNYPLNITTEYMVDPKKNYDSVDLAFFYRGEATSPQASEKQLMILCETSKAGTEEESSLVLGTIADGLNKTISAIIA
jgi:hypothetical protein